MPAKYVRAHSKGQKNDFRAPEAIAEAVQRPAMKFVATKTADQLDLQTVHRVRERLVRQRTGIINQIRAFPLERGIAVRQGLRFLRTDCRASLPSAPTCYRRAWCASSRNWQVNGAGLASASKACPPTSRVWWRKTRRASA
jgi:transposase